MSTNHFYQVMPDFSLEEHAALKVSIAANGVRVPIDVDEEGNILDGHRRQEICDELGRECPKRVIPGLTEAQKIEYAWQVNMARRHLSKAQKRQLAEKLWLEGQTQERIAQRLGVTQSTISNWVREFIKSGKLPASPTGKGKDGKRYRRTKAQRRTTHPTEQANGPKTSQLPSDAGDGQAQAPEHQETPQLRDTPAEAELPTSERAAASDVPDAPQTPPLISDGLQMEARQRANSQLGSSPGQPAEVDAEGWVNALQDLFAELETLQAQGRLLPPSTDWTPDTRARGLATIRRIQGICSDLAGVVEANMRETAARNGHDVGDTTSPFLPPSIDSVQVQGNGELVTVPSAEASVGEVAKGDQLPSQAFWGRFLKR